MDKKQQLPHNYACIQTSKKEIYIIGGGDYSDTAVPKESRLCSLLFLNQKEDFFFRKKRAKLSYPRHGHAICQLSKKFLLVTGSRWLTFNDSDCELYDMQRNKWSKVAKLNEPRFYHSTCSIRNEPTAYVFCGSNKTYLRSIERFNQAANTWTLIDLYAGELEKRQGCGSV